MNPKPYQPSLFDAIQTQPEAAPAMLQPYNHEPAPDVTPITRQANALPFGTIVRLTSSDRLGFPYALICNEGQRVHGTDAGYYRYHALCFIDLEAAAADYRNHCNHPPERLYSWTVEDAAGSALILGCTQCGKTWERPFKPLRSVTHTHTNK